MAIKALDNLPQGYIDLLVDMFGEDWEDYILEIQNDAFKEGENPTRPQLPWDADL